MDDAIAAGRSGGEGLRSSFKLRGLEVEGERRAETLIFISYVDCLGAAILITCRVGSIISVTGNLEGKLRS